MKLETIKSKKDLPEWFTNRVYKKNNSAVEWYMEIRRRTYLLKLVELSFELSVKPDEQLIQLWLSVPPKDAFIYLMHQHNRPVQPLTIFETCYLRAAMSDDKIDVAYEKLATLIKMWKFELNRKDANLFTWEYEKYLREFSIFIDENDWLNDDVLGVTDLGNPLLSYGRPLTGTPLIIDTQFDDQTIVEGLKIWLSEQRKLNNEKMKRPLNQNDFDDWTYFRIREVIDLDIWSKLSGVKILDKVIASVLWSDSVDDVSPIDILRTTTRKKIKEVFNHEMAVRFYGQLIQEKGENFLEQ